MNVYNKLNHGSYLLENDYFSINCLKRGDVSTTPGFITNAPTKI